MAAGWLEKVARSKVTNSLSNITNFTPTDISLTLRAAGVHCAP